MAAAAALAELHQALVWIGFGDQGNRDTICQEAGLLSFEDFDGLTEKDIRDMAEEFSKRTVFENTPKVCKIQFVATSRQYAVLDMRPSTTNNFTSNQDPKFTALSSPTLLSGQDRIPSNGSQTSPEDHHNIANKPRRSANHRWACGILHIETRSSRPNNRPTMT